MNKVSIGIIGCNEEEGVAALLDSLKHQTIFTDTHYETEIVVISNGSRDRMASVATEKLKPFTSSNTQVVELELADKCAAWNHYIHSVSVAADYYILLDADVVLIDPLGLVEMLEILKNNPQCRICGAKIVNEKGVLISNTVDGKCYAAPGEVLRNIAIPNGVVLDDAYILITTVTNWYETDFETGQQKGYVGQSENIIVSCGKTKGDKKIRYWIASRKRTVTSAYTQERVDCCMRHLFGGGEMAKKISMELFKSNPNWFLSFLKQESAYPDFQKPTLNCFLSIKAFLQYIAYCYGYLLVIQGIKNKEFGHLAWKLKGRFW
ncbi:glycosyltransferase family 2 protein [Lusitaniella coriacea LEGE 07157]|uniref:Glycosyltransferase family 2 protein n=1 Tax=Lusitaniella coriacea LEGE 07157 TaxID=945747 RepID=A0A8J7AMC7_9CYAN|nr:glycosyltransferase family A protein [Lusitaniella coriacea]MBE9114483.1 glycosyltransferase family 2 protein [Lusitaniella coriacea LEGE 07157]